MALEYHNGRPVYYRKRWQSGRVLSEYVASGEAAILIAADDAEQARRRREEAAERRRRERRLLGDLQAGDRETVAYFVQVERAVALALGTAGYYRAGHGRGEWRRRPGAGKAPDPERTGECGG